MRRSLGALAVFGLLTVLVACDSGSEGEKPPPAALNRDAVGHYCGMIVVDHSGPKAQIHLRSGERVVWFTSVRDGISFTRLPEEPDDIVAFYVNDIASAENWNNPGDDTWIDAHSAVYVIGSTRRGGMGALEAVPFSDEVAAKAFTEQHGGRVVKLEEIPDDYVLGDGDPQPAAMHGHGSGH